MCCTGRSFAALMKPLAIPLGNQKTVAKWLVNSINDTATILRDSFRHEYHA